MFGWFEVQGMGDKNTDYQKTCNSFKEIRRQKFLWKFNSPRCYDNSFCLRVIRVCIGVYIYIVTPLKKNIWSIKEGVTLDLVRCQNLCIFSFIPLKMMHGTLFIWTLVSRSTTIFCCNSFFLSLVDCWIIFLIYNIL